MMTRHDTRRRILDVEDVSGATHLTAHWIIVAAMDWRAVRVSGLQPLPIPVAINKEPKPSRCGYVGCAEGNSGAFAARFVRVDFLSSPPTLARQSPDCEIPGGKRKPSYV